MILRFVKQNMVQCINFKRKIDEKPWDNKTKKSVSRPERCGRRVGRRQSEATDDPAAPWARPRWYASRDEGERDAASL